MKTMPKTLYLAIIETDECAIVEIATDKEDALKAVQEYACEQLKCSPNENDVQGDIDYWFHENDREFYSIYPLELTHDEALVLGTYLTMED